LAYPFLRVNNLILKKPRQGRLRVLLYHDVGPNEIDFFANQIKWLSKTWKFITPKDFESIMAGNRHIEQDSLLLTFDDGFVSNGIVAEKVLNPLGIKAVFFVVSEFVNFKNKKRSSEFIARNIFPNLKLIDLPNHWHNLEWKDIEILHQSGHTIGGHTATHARLSDLKSMCDLNDEIVNSANVIEHRLGIQVNHFAYTFGDLASINEEALIIAKKRFDFVYSGLRGFNTAETSPYAIRRDSVSPRQPAPLIGSFLEGGADSKYSLSKSTLDEWLRVTL